MSDIQRITVRNATTELQIADNQTTGNIDIGGAQTTGNIYVGNSAARTTGAVQIGTLTGSGQTLLRGNTINANSNSSSTYQGSLVNVISTSGSVNVQSNGSTSLTSITSTANVTGATSSTVKASNGTMKIESTLGAVDIDASANITLDSAAIITQTTGNQALNASGRIDLTSVGNTAITTTAGSFDIISGGSADIVANAGGGTFRCTGNSTFGTTGSGATDYFGDNNSVCRVANGTVDKSIIIGTAQTTGGLFLGTNAGRLLGGNIYLGSSTGTHITYIRGGAFQEVMSGNHTADVDGNYDVNVVGAVTIDSSGVTSDITVTAARDTFIRAAGDVIVETIDAGQTTFLGSTNVQGTTRLCNGATTASLIVGSQQTSGSIIIGGNSLRTGSVSFGSATGNYLFNARAGTMNLQTTAVAGDMTIVSSRDIAMTAVGNITINSTGGATSVQGVDMASSTGAWTPGVEDAAGAAFGGVTSSGVYVKWGRHVHLSGTVAWTGKGTAAAGEFFKITGIPFNRYTATGFVFGEFNDTSWYAVPASDKVTLRMADVNKIDFYTENLLTPVSDITTAGGFSFTVAYIAA